MNISDHLTETRQTEAEFAAKIGASQSYVHRLKKGEVWPSADMARRIMDATSGAVTPNDFLPPNEAQPAFTDIVNGRKT